MDDLPKIFVINITYDEETETLGLDWNDEEADMYRVLGFLYRAIDFHSNNMDEAENDDE